MKWFKFVVLLAICAVLQAESVNYIAVKNIKPDLLLILLVYFSVVFRDKEQIISSFAIGFSADLISSVMGPYTISCLAVGTVLSNLNQYLIIKTKAHQGIAIFICGMIINTSALLLTYLATKTATQNSLSLIFGDPVYSGIIGPFFLLPIALIMNIKTPAKKSPDK